MAGGLDLGGSGGKGRRPLDAVVNLVPFIDLMAVTIVFLIMTAVWTQVGRIQVSQPSSEGLPPVHDSAPIELRLDAKAVVLEFGRPLDTFPLTRDGRGRLEVNQLATRLRQLKDEWPQVADLTVKTADDVPYADLVRVIDAAQADAKGELFPVVRVSPL